MSADRLAHLREVAPLLWPAPHTAEHDGGNHGAARSVVAEYLLLPSARAPRLLVPTGRRAGAAVVRHHGEGRNPTARLAALALSSALRCGLGPLLRGQRLRVTAPRGDVPASLPAHLGILLGQEVAVGMHLGPPRANRKPVLQVLDRGGRTLAYAKLGVDTLTDGLVAQEAAALAALSAADVPGVRAPSLLHAGEWRGHRLLVQAALPVWAARRPLTRERLCGAVTAVASVGRVDDVPLGASPYWRQLTDRVSRLPEGGAATEVHRLVERLHRSAADVRLSFGASHGDWTRWNMASVDGGLLVWDWERYRPDVPVGADLLHFGLQDDLVTRRDDPATSARRMVDGAVEELRPLGLTAPAARLTALLYAVDLAVRYLTDRQLEAGARLGDVAGWLLPAVDRGTSRTEEGTGE